MKRALLKGKIYYSKSTQNLSILEEGYLTSAHNVSIGIFGGFRKKPNINTENIGKSISEVCFYLML